jgi:hypothetical protein
MIFTLLVSPDALVLTTQQRRAGRTWLGGHAQWLSAESSLPTASRAQTSFACDDAGLWVIARLSAKCWRATEGLGFWRRTGRIGLWPAQGVRPGRRRTNPACVGSGQQTAMLAGAGWPWVPVGICFQPVDAGGGDRPHARPRPPRGAPFGGPRSDARRESRVRRECGPSLPMGRT